MGIRIGIGGLTIGSSSSRGWTPQLTLKYSALSGDDIIEDSGKNAKITKYPVLRCVRVNDSSGTSLAVSDNGALDIAVTGEISIAAWIKTSTNISATFYILGKNTGGAVGGKYGIAIIGGKFYATSRDTLDRVVVSIGSVVANTWYHVILTAKSSNKIQLYINKAPQSAGTNTGVYPAMANEFEFYVSGGNSTDGSAYTLPYDGYVSDARVFNYVISEAEREKCYNREIVGTEIAYYPMEDVNSLNTFRDASGNGRHLNKQGAYSILSSHWLYDTGGGRYNKKYGYSVWLMANNVDIYVPYGINGMPVALTIGTDIGAEYFKGLDVPASTTKFNLAPAIIDFDPDDTAHEDLAIFDRSNVAIHNAASRLSAYYLVGSPYEYHSSEINISKLKGFYESDYLWRVFPHVESNSVSVGARLYLDEILVTKLKQTESEKLKALKYTGDYNRFYTIDYYYEDRQISAVLNNKTLFCNDAGVLSLSLDNGTTILRTLDASADLTIVTFAHIFANGNILFCGQRKAYLSTDSLQTYAETTVLDITGAAYSAIANGVFRSIGYEPTTINGREVLVWGCYATEANTEYSDINIWYSVDSGETIKSAYKFGVSLNPALAARHVHGVHFNSNDNSFWVQTGDAAVVGDECNLIKSSYNLTTDIWTFTAIAADIGGDDGWFKQIGSEFYNNYLYFGMDIFSSQRAGIWRAPYSDPSDSAEFQRVEKRSMMLGFLGSGNGEMIGIVGTDDKIIYMSLDGLKFDQYLLAGGADMSVDYKYIINLKHPDARGYYRADQTSDGQTYPNFTQGQVLMIRFKKNE